MIRRSQVGSRLLQMAAALCLTTMSPKGAPAQTPPGIAAFSPAAILDASGRLLDASGRWLDGIVSLLMRGSDKAANAALADTLSEVLRDSMASGNAAAAVPFDEFLRDPTDQNWSNVKTKVRTSLLRVREALHTLEQQNNGILDQTAYRLLRGELGEKTQLLDEFGQLAKPVSGADMSRVRNIASKFKEMLTKKEAAIAELQVYVASVRSPRP